MEDTTDTEYSTWNVVYPQYLDKDSTTTQGRKVNSTIAVSKPTIEEIKIVLDRLNVPYVLEPRKRYPRNWMFPGRFRVNLRDPNTNEKVKSKKQLLNELATMISQLKSRQQPKPAPTTTSTSSTGKKKSGKKKR